MARLDITVDRGDLSAGLGILGRIEEVLERIARATERQRQQLPAIRRAQDRQNTNLKTQLSLYQQVNRRVGEQTNRVRQTERAQRAAGRAIRDQERAIRRSIAAAKALELQWARVGRRIGLAVSRISRGAARGAGTALDRVTGRASEALSGILGGGGLSGVVGGAIRAPFRVAQFGLQIGGDLGRSILTGVGDALSGVGAGISGAVGGLGAIPGSVLSAIGGLTGIAGEIGGRIFAGAGKLIGAAGDFGGKIAESLLGGISKGLLVGIGLAGFSLFKGFRLERAELGFEAFNSSLKTTQEALEGFREASRGTVKDSELLLQSTRALAAGAVQGLGEFETLLEGASRLGRFTRSGTSEEALQRLTLGLVTQQRRLIDDLTLIVRVGESNQKIAAELGKSVEELTAAESQEGFREAVFLALEKRLVKLRELPDSADTSFKKLTTSVANLAERFGKSLIPVADVLISKIQPLVDTTLEWVTANEELISSSILEFFEDLPENLGRAADGAKELVDQLFRFVGLDFTVDGLLGRLEGKSIGDILAEGLERSKTKIADTFGSVFESERLAKGIQSLAKSFTEGILKFLQESNIGDKALSFIGSSSGSVARGVGGAVLSNIRDRAIGPAGSTTTERIQAAGRFGFGNIGDRFGAALGGSGGPGGSGLTPILSGGIGGRAAQGIPFPTRQEELTDRTREGLDSLRRLAPTIERLNFVLERLAGRGVASDTPNRAFRSELSSANRAFDRSVRNEFRSEVQGLKDQISSASFAFGLSTDAIEEETRVRSDAVSRRIQIDEDLDRTLTALSSQFEQATDRVRSFSESALAALPGDVADRFQGSTDLPGLSLNARAALRRPQRLAERERVRDINRTFGSPSFQDAFTPEGGADPFGVFGAGRGGGISADPFGGISGPESAAESEAALLEAVQGSLEFIREAAAIREEANRELIKLEAERLSAEKDAVVNAKAFHEQAIATITESLDLSKEFAAQLKKVQDRFTALEAELARVKSLARSGTR